MSKSTYTTKIPWQDRWAEPTLAQLLDPVKESHRKPLDNLMAAVEAYEGVTRKIIWAGLGWQWTIEYCLEGKHESGHESPDAFVYIVPDPEQPQFVIPLRDEDIEQVPIRRVNRFIRDQLRSAKCSVGIHWCKWSPSAQTEVEHLLDLLKRKWKILTGKKR